MSKGHQGDLANLWAVGGKQSGLMFSESSRFYYRYCPQCGWQLTGKFSTCPRCGADLRMKICDYSGGMVPLSTKICPRCSGLIE